MPADAATALKEKFPQATARPSVDHPAFNVPIADVPAVLAFLRDELAFELLMDVTAIDNGEHSSPRFTVVYHVLSVTHPGAYLRIAADCANDAEPTAPSVVALWAGANWHEREVYDMFGIKFTGHPDLRRILMWDGYPYHPLRKEFPLAGIETDLPVEDIAEETGTKVIAAPMQGGPFVASPGEINLTEAEPRAKDETWSDRRAKPGHSELRQVKE
ncbi:NADH-quinone oxidoreductase subunit C [Opitutus sp. ER46]|uniref:NADH-quinone oxidoreductase subunit C n=1 Tax=Opitutus sp. ER46 TaxID=2161864 RepID=UPI000D3193AE|nr:NADH-quinone oxidoreductase subunit C [Opitutus sp. ER46]PTX95784.1 NADH-quinone oxidoreductase subunit C [Opitutus sp. ER46]